MSVPRRSFWAVLGLAGLAEALAIGGAIWASRTVLACWWAPLRPAGWQPGAACEHLVPVTRWNAWVPALVLVGVAVASIVATAVLIVAQLLRARRLRRGLGPPMLPSLQVARLAAEVGVRRLVVVDGPPSDCCVCMGLIWPRVVVSSAVIVGLTPPQLRAVLAHEGAHARRRDPLLIMLARAAGAGLFFVPLARQLGRLALARAELAADAVAVQAAGRPALAGALLAVGQVPQSPGAMAHVASEGVMDQRIAALRGATQPGMAVVGRLLAGAMVVLGALTCLMVAWLQPLSSAPPLIAPVHAVPQQVRPPT